MLAPVSGATGVAGLIGWPVAHSRSPAMHNAAYRALGIDLVYVAFAVAPDRSVAAVAAMRTLSLRGLSVTMPHKAAVITALDEVSPRATDLGAVNCITNADGTLIGDNTDGAGFLAGYEHDVGESVVGKRVAIIGAGGAARAIAEACGQAKAQRVGILNRTRDRAETAAALAGDAGSVLPDEAALAEFDVVVNATPVGMADSAGATPLDVSRLADEAVVVDIVYDPIETELLRQARGRGLRAHGGLAMLAGQAALQIEAWTGQRPDLDALIAAAQD